MPERSIDRQARSMFEVWGGLDNVCYSYRLEGDSDDPWTILIIKRGGGDLSRAYDALERFVLRNSQWETKDGRLASREELESITYLLRQLGVKV